MSEKALLTGQYCLVELSEQARITSLNVVLVGDRIPAAGRHIIYECTVIEELFRDDGRESWAPGESRQLAEVNMQLIPNFTEWEWLRRLQRWINSRQILGKPYEVVETTFRGNVHTHTVVPIKMRYHRSMVLPMFECVDSNGTSMELHELQLERGTIELRPTIRV
jgi:hypothetical protein